MASNAEPKLCCTSVLLDEIQFAVVLGIIVAQVATRYDVLLEEWLLRCEIVLSVKEMPTATAGLSFRTLGASALNREATFRPKAALADNLLHALEPPRITRVVI
jgi:hypothetical protein